MRPALVRQFVRLPLAAMQPAAAAAACSRPAARSLAICAAAAGAAGLAAAATTGAAHAKAVSASPAQRAMDKDLVEHARRVGRRGLRDMIQPFDTGFIYATTAAGVVHEVYYEQCGNPNGKPVIIVHGGPGGGCPPAYRCFHDPAKYRIILFDQRGCGRSLPHAELDENTTWHLVADMERIRARLGIEKWQVFGGSWGSTLSLSYAVTHPKAVTELVLRGIFMLRKSELAFYYQNGASHIYPDRWEEYRDTIPAEERGDFIQAYRKRLVGDDPVEQIKAAKAWTRWENTTSNLYGPVGDVAGDEDKFALAFARIENHFFVHGGFFEWESYLLDKVDVIRHIPTFIVQGRYDVVCPATSAWDLHRKFPEAEFVIVEDSGHSAMEPGTLAELVAATDRFADL